MTVASDVNKVTYSCDGVRKTFGFGFKIFAPTDLIVAMENVVNGDVTELEYGTEYTVTGINGQYADGGSVTTMQTWSEDHTVTILRRVQILQQTDYRSTEVFSADAHEAAMDRLTMISQQLQETLQRTIRVAVTDESLLELPSAVARANKYFAFGDQGQVVVAPSAAGQALMAGSAIAYVGDYSASWPTVRPDMVTGLDNDDTGRIALDIGGGRMRLAIYRHGTGWIVLQSVYNGNLIIGPSPITTIEFQESDQTDPAGRLRIQADGDEFTILRKTAAGTPGTWAAALTINRSTGTVTLGGAMSLGANKITGLAAGTANGEAVRYEQLVTMPVVPTLPAENPTADNHAVRKKYVDDAVAGVRLGYVKVSEVQAQDTPGGTFTAGTWVKRVINVEDNDEANLCSINNSQITLAAGTYDCLITAPGESCGVHQAVLYNVTADAVQLRGGNVRSGSSVQVNAMVRGRFTILTPATFEIRHRCTVSSSTTGLGMDTNFAPEVYTVAEFWKIG